jgi:hypothetical protein
VRRRIFKTKLNSQVTDKKSTAVPSPAVNRAEQIDLANAIVLVHYVRLRSIDLRRLCKVSAT